DPHLKPITRANEPPLRRKVASGFDSLVAACVNPAITPMASSRTTIFLTWFIVYLLLVLLSCRKINKDFCAAASACIERRSNMSSNFRLGDTPYNEWLPRSPLRAMPSGVGMGLAIVRSIVEAHGGKIDAENVSDGVARFYFSLPITKPPDRRCGEDVLSRGPDL